MTKFTAEQIDEINRCARAVVVRVDERLNIIQRQIDNLSARFSRIHQRLDFLEDTELLSRPRRSAHGILKELDLGWLAHDLPEHGLRAGERGTVVLAYNGGEGFEVEFAEKGIVVTLPRHSLVGKDHD
jgi:hypothetical protein